MDAAEKELGELASERKRVEWLGKSLAMLNPDAMKLRLKQDSKQQMLDPERISNPRVTTGCKEEPGPSGNKRNRSAISPRRESGKKMFRSDAGKKALTIKPSADNQLTADPRDAGIVNMTGSEVLSPGGNYLFAHNIREKMRQSQGLPKLQDTSISRRPPHKLVAKFKTCVKEASSTKDIEFPSLENNYITVTQGGESDRPFGDQVAIKRKSLRPPGSIFKVATPISWFPRNSTGNTGRNKDVLSSALILEASGTGETAGKSMLRPKNVNTPDRKEKKRGNKMVSHGVSEKPLGERSLREADCPERHTHKICEVSSDLRKWLLTPSGFDLNCQKDSAFKSDLPCVRSRATEPQASRSRTDVRTLERQSWSERMKAFLISCGALLTETNTSKHTRQSKRPSLGDDVHKEVKKIPEMTTLNPMQKKDGSVSLVPKIVNDEDLVKKLDRRRGPLDNARNKLRSTSAAGTSPGNERSWGSPRNSTGLRNVDKLDGGKKLIVKKTKLRRSVIGQKKGNDMLLTMLNKVSTGITKQKQMVKPKSFQNASERKTKAPDALGKYPTALVSLKVKDRARLANTSRAEEVSKRGPKKWRLMDVKAAQDCVLLHRHKEDNGMQTTSPVRVLDIKSEESEYQNNITQVRKSVRGSHVRRDSDRGIQFVIQEMKGSVENWLNVSGGFEFLDSAYEDKKGVSSTALKSADFRSSSDRTSLHSWSVRSAEPEALAPVSVGKQGLHRKSSKASQQNISPVSCMRVQSGSLHQGFLSERQEVHTKRSSRPQEELQEKSPRDTSGNDNSILRQVSLQPPGLAVFDSDPLQSFLHVFQEYREKPEVRGSMTCGITECGESFIVDGQESEKLDCLDFKSQKRTSSCDVGTRSSSASEDKLTEDEELELALLELVIKTVLRDDLLKNAKSGPFTPKEETPSLARDQRKSQRPHVDKGVQALVLDLVHDVSQLSPTQQASDLAKSSDWPDYTFLAEKHDSRSESCDDDGDWPEYLGLDEQTGNVEEMERDSPVREDSSKKILEPETFHGTSVLTDMTEPLHGSRTSPISSLPTHISQNNDREFVPFSGVSSLAFPCLPTPQSEGSTSYIVNRSSTGVQTNDFPVAQPLNSVYLLPLYCLPDGRPLLAPYSMYPQYPEVPSHNQPMHIPPSMQNIHSHTKVAAISEDVQGTTDMHPSRTEELPVSSRENESRLLLERKSSSTTSSDGPVSSPRTPSTPISSPEHEARVASALAHYRRSQKRPVAPFSPDAIDDASKLKGEKEACQTEQKVDNQQLVVSTEEPPALARNLYARGGHEESKLEQLTEITVDYQLSGEVVPRSFGAASPSTRKEQELVTPFVYYDDTGSAELANSYDGSGSSDVSVYPRMYSGVDVPFAGLSEGLERLNPATGSVSVTETRAQSPGETQHPALVSGRQADGLRANLGRYPLGGHLMYSERDLARWPEAAGEPGLPFSEGEIELGGLLSEGECGRTYNRSEVSHHNFLYTAHQNTGEVSEPGEVGRFAGQQIKTKGNSMEKGSLIQSLSEGEIKAEMIQRGEPGEMNTPSGSAKERLFSE